MGDGGGRTRRESWGGRGSKRKEGGGRRRKSGRVAHTRTQSWPGLLPQRMALCARYAMSGTTLAYGAMRLLCDVRYHPSVWRYALAMQYPVPP
eukprot:3398880-Rhodomonas_salina.1